MKILWLFPGGMFKNGICVSQLDYYKKINKKKYVIDVATISDSSVEMIDQYLEQECKVYVLSNKRKKIISYMKELNKLLRDNDYDIVHVHGSSTLLFVELLIAKKNGVKARIAHSRNTSSSHLKLENFFRPIFDKTYNYAIACGKDAGEWLFKKNKFVVFHNGKELDKYKFDEKVRKKYRTILHIEERVAIGHVGVFSEQKNHFLLIDIFKKIYDDNNDTCLFLFGTGILKSKIEKKVHDIGLDNCVYFMGNSDNIQDYYQAMDVMLFPSYFEGLPNVVVEWQASGLPVIMSDKITKECVCTNQVKRLPIDKGVEKWAQEFKNTKLLDTVERKKISEFACQQLINNGFEINNNTKYLEKYYDDCIKKNILFVTNKLIGGGSERVLTTVANKLSSIYNVSILAVQKSGFYKVDSKIKVLILGKSISKLKKIFKMRKVISKMKPDVIISFEYFINMQVCMARFGKKNRLIISERNDPNVRGNNYKYLRNFLYRISDVLVCQTEDAKNYFPKYIRKKAVVILNPIKEDLPKSNDEEREKVIVNFCRLEKQKNLKLLIDAFNIVSKKFSDYKLYIYGDGNEKRNLLDYIKSKGLNNKVFIFPFDDNIHDKIKNYTMYVSSSDYEGLSNSMLEAMAIGLPTICTDCPCGGARMVIRDGYNGVLVPVGDVNKLSNAILKILEDEELRQKLSSNAIEIRKFLSINKIVEEWNKII